ncbi:predicted protein [Postia placenta Mad-698-R]|nr:predicted protein [Postia placenta Mad-698-R]
MSGGLMNSAKVGHVQGRLRDRAPSGSELWALGFDQPNLLCQFSFSSVHHDVASFFDLPTQNVRPEISSEECQTQPIPNSSEVSRMGLFLYDYVINFNQEHHVVWSCRVTGGVAVFVALRYATLAAYIVEIIYISTQCATYFAQAAFAAIRVYAIQRGRWPLSVVVMALGLVPVATNIYAVSQVKLVDAFQYCLLDSAISINNQHIWMDPYTSGGQSTRSIPSSNLMPHYRIISALNAANIVTNLLEGTGIDITMPVEIFSTVLLCRFYLNLRRVADKDDPVGPAASISSTTFSSRITGNMGEMLEFGSYLPDDLSLNSDADAMEQQTHDAVEQEEGRVEYRSSPEDTLGSEDGASNQKAWQRLEAEISSSS